MDVKLRLPFLDAVRTCIVEDPVDESRNLNCVLGEMQEIQAPQALSGDKESMLKIGMLAELGVYNHVGHAEAVSSPALLLAHAIHHWSTAVKLTLPTCQIVRRICRI